MKLLVVGSGGREHALVWKLAQSERISAMWCAPGNAGIASEKLANGSPVECVPISADDLEGLRKFAQEKRVEFTVVGPDNPLAAGVVDLFQAAGLRIWGPNQKAAQFEASKVFRRCSVLHRCREPVCGLAMSGKAWLFRRRKVHAAKFPHPPNTPG